MVGCAGERNSMGSSFFVISGVMSLGVVWSPVFERSTARGLRKLEDRGLRDYM